MSATSHLYILGFILLCSAAASYGYSYLDVMCDDGKEHNWRYPYDCKKYYGCLNRNTTIFECGKHLFWNDIIKACDVLERTDCSHIVPPDCSDGKNTYYRYPYDCSMFWECLDQQLLLLSCPEGTDWDDISKQCKDTSEVDCSGIIPTSTQAPPTDPTATTIKPTPSPTDSPTTPSIDCTSAQYYPDPSDCSRYYECDHGKAISMQCDKGTLWNPVINTCDHPENVDCGTRPTIPDIISSTTSAPPTQPTSPPTDPTPTTINPTPSPTDSPTTPSMDCTSAQYYPDPSDCSSYYECDNGKAKLMQCDKGTLWNPLLNTCDHPEDVDCGTRPTIPDIITSSTPAPPTQPTSPPTQPTSPLTQPTSPPTQPTSPPTQPTSPPTQPTSPPTQPTSPPTVPTPTTMKPTPAPTDSPTTPSMDCTSAQYYSDPSDCSRYYECDHGKAKLMQCDKGTLWNPLFNTCDHPEDVDCGTRPTIRPPTY